MGGWQVIGAIVIGPNNIGIAAVVPGPNSAVAEVVHRSVGGWSAAEAGMVLIQECSRVYYGRLPNSGPGEWDDWLIELEQSIQGQGIEGIRIEQIDPSAWQGQPDYGLLPEERVASQLCAMEVAGWQEF